jgi:lysophospholipase L1-like esterase
MGTDNSSSSSEPSPLAVRRVTYDKIILFGDSLTELSSDVLSLSFALTPALQHHYFRKLAVVARGYGGYNSEHLRHVLLPTLRAETAAGERVRLLVLEVGTNDASMNEMQCVPVESYVKNLRWMVEQARAAGVERVIVVGPGPVDEGRLASPVNNRTMRNLEYDEAARAVSEQCGAPFVDMWLALLLKTGWKTGQPVPGKQESGGGDGLGSLLTDGVHLSGYGYRIWYQELVKTIREKFPELRSEALPTVLPHIYDVDRNNLPDTLWQEVQVKQ